ncbi:unnamed protein product [Fraxinus pennsylvanica]|uniref:Uncharacterized protein n=1 Tax=Fraxinus pennsylvanica TaxID=56036 RepID=A0AAD2DL17_9LAMI|nr:unnamed protein product [Fraxinus pennsylvanica]
MATLESMLFEAAAAGNVNSLQKLLQEDPLILDRVVVSCFHETPVHIAALLGHIGFVREILRRKPEFARELNLHLSSPLHLASAKDDFSAGSQFRDTCQPFFPLLRPPLAVSCTVPSSFPLLSLFLLDIKEEDMFDLVGETRGKEEDIFNLRMEM